MQRGKTLHGDQRSWELRDVDREEVGHAILLDADDAFLTLDGLGVGEAVVLQNVDEFLHKLLHQNACDPGIAGGPAGAAAGAA